MLDYPMLPFIRTLRKDPTEAERRLWYRLRRRQLGGVKFRRQHPIGPYICDFASVECGIVVELDGSQHVERTTYDESRDAYLRSKGLRVLRFWNGDVLCRPEVVLETIFEAMNRPEMDGRFE